MERPIDEHIEVLKSYHYGFTGCASNLQDSIDVAVDIMRKYKKIQELMVGWYNFNYYEILYTMYKVNLLLGEETEDGNGE